VEPTAGDDEQQHFTGPEWTGGLFGSGASDEHDHEPPPYPEHEPYMDHAHGGHSPYSVVHDAAATEAHHLAEASPFHFDIDDIDSNDDYDLNHDGVVNRGDAHAAFHALHDFHVEAPEVHHDPPDHGFFHH
jgi:hypothetical protein